MPPIQTAPVMDDLKRSILKYKQWRHRIELEENFTTPGYLILEDWEKLGLPLTMEGKSFLDVGSNDGYFSFIAEKRGAKEVLATDLYFENVSSSSSGTGWNIEGIRLAKNYLNSIVEIKSQSIYELAELEKTFDFVFCSDVIAWLDNLPLAIKNLAAVTRDTLIIRDSLFGKLNRYPLLRYEEGKLFFRPNKAFMEKILKELGFREVKFCRMDQSPNSSFTTFSLYHINEEARIYEHPYASEPENLMTGAARGTSTCYMNGRQYFRNIGWIDDSDIRIIPQNSGPVKKILEPILGAKRYHLLKSYWFAMKSDVVPYAIIAKK